MASQKPLHHKIQALKEEIGLSDGVIDMLLDNKSKLYTENKELKLHIIKLRNAMSILLNMAKDNNEELDFSGFENILKEGEGF